jgi:hypothetical protein
MPDFTAQVWGGERIFIAGFSRAKTGVAHMDYPDPDDIGFTDDANRAEHGPLFNAITRAAGTKIRFHRMEISTAARLYLVSTDPALVRIINPASGLLSSARSQNFTFVTGPNPGRAAIEVRYKWKDGPVIGRCYVQVNERINIRLRLHLVTDVAGNTHGAAFLGGTASTVAARHAAMRRMFSGVNHIWVPYGIFFQSEATVFNTTWNAAALGTATYPPPNNNLHRAGALEANRAADRVNIYFVPDFASAQTVAFARSVHRARLLGSLFPVGAPAASQHLANQVFVRTRGAAPASALAHELGHYLDLCAIDGAAPWAFHSSADQKVASNDQKIRDDSFTRRRLLYPYIALPRMATKPWRNNVGYGNGETGGMVSCRQLSQDVSLDETNRARTAAGSAANLYAP